MKDLYSQCIKINSKEESPIHIYICIYRHHLYINMYFYVISYIISSLPIQSPLLYFTSPIHVMRRLPLLLRFATSWYMTIFSSSFPFDLVTRVWDAFLAEGFKIIHRVALSLLKCFSDIILSLGFEELISFLQHDLPNQVDPDYIMSEAFKIPLKKVQIESIAEQYNIQFPEKKNKNSNNSTKGSAAASR
mmetsp:Transcript_2134/g.2653  ORF Transcript_2134/g.2653 Transcript_2134/m.2653 type:complete len:190 (-) Transcript_2134:236-805(-)